MPKIDSDKTRKLRRARWNLKNYQRKLASCPPEKRAWLDRLHVEAVQLVTESLFSKG